MSSSKGVDILEPTKSFKNKKSILYFEKMDSATDPSILYDTDTSSSDYEPSIISNEYDILVQEKRKNKMNNDRPIKLTKKRRDNSHLDVSTPPALNPKPVIIPAVEVLAPAADSRNEKDKDNLLEIDSQK